MSAWPERICEDATRAAGTVQFTVKTAVFELPNWFVASSAILRGLTVPGGLGAREVRAAGGRVALDGSPAAVSRVRIAEALAGHTGRQERLRR